MKLYRGVYNKRMPDNAATQGLTCKESLHQRKKVAWRSGDAAFGNLQTLNYRMVWFGSKKKALSRSRLGSCPSAITLHQHAEDGSTPTPADLVEPSFWGRVVQT